MAPSGYQGITNADIPVVELANGSGVARVIAGDFGGVKGPAKTFTPINVWDLRLTRDADMTLSLPEGHTAMLVVLGGKLTVEGKQDVGEAEMLMLSREGSEVHLRADGDTTILVLTGEPIDEPVVGYGPFVMNTEAEIRQAIDDVNTGRFVQAA